MNTLRRELGIAEAVAVSVALMCPTLVAVLVGAGMAGMVGVGVSLTMLVTAIGVMLVAYGFVRLTRSYNHAGSTYALTAAALGPRSGFFAGFALLGTYMVFCGSTIAATGLFGSTFLDSVGIWDGASWTVISLVAVVVVALLASAEVRAVTRTLLGFEGIAVLIVLSVAAIILIKVATGSAPGDQSFSLEPFDPSALSSSNLGPALVLGFFSWAGFEAAAALGEETANPRRNIPLAVVVGVLVGAAIYIFAFFAQTLGFGASEAGAKAYASSSSPMGELAARYIGGAMGDILNFAAFVSSFAGAIAAATGAGRLLFAMARDGFGARALARVNHSGAPGVAIATAMTFGAGLIVSVGVIADEAAADSFFYLGTIASLALLVAYGMTNAAALRDVFRGTATKSAWEPVVLLAGIAFVAFVLYKSIYPVQPAPYKYFPYIVAGYLTLGLAIALFSPRLAERVGAGLAQQEGFVSDSPASGPRAFSTGTSRTQGDRL